ncbi:MAG TPA: hypothetical protein QGH10_12930, partial [Armatimonadota bacterium]|nr:hypothetical protein [Armatimonadota bacterium]
MRSTCPGVLAVLAAIVSTVAFAAHSACAQEAATPEIEGAVMQKLNVEVRSDPDGERVSPFLASASCHGLKRHTLKNDGWQRSMNRLFGGNLLVLLQGAYKKPDEDGNWWDFEAIDTFIREARETWDVEELMFLPQWWIGEWDGKSEPTAEQFDRSSQALTQLVQRYGVAGPLQVRYWVACDEWSGAEYWTANPEKFAEYYAGLVRDIKAVSTDLMVGGPVDAWPSSAIVEALLKECPELDFIAWNLFICGSADFPLDQLFAKTSALEREVLRSRQLSREILGKELPVMVSSYNVNFHAWDPPDTRMASPIGGVWNALALVHLARAGAFSGVMYNVLALDCGMFGPRYGYAITAGMLPASI